MVEVPYERMFESGAISIENSVNCWRVTNEGIDFIALKLLWKIFEEYQLKDILPEKVGFMV